MAKVRTRVDSLLTKPASTNDRGNAVHSAFGPSERYVVDFADDFGPDGWAQFDTNQDAHYFGVWVNWRRMMTLTYCEGDWSLVACPTRESYLAEIRNCIEFYGEGKVATIIGAAGSIEYCQDRAKFLCEPGQATESIADVLNAIGGASS